jgi:hypothetical protein
VAKETAEIPRNNLLLIHFTITHSQNTQRDDTLSTMLSNDMKPNEKSVTSEATTVSSAFPIPFLKGVLGGDSDISRYVNESTTRGWKCRNPSITHVLFLSFFVVD